MAIMRRRENSTMPDVYHQHSMTMPESSSTKPPAMYQRHLSVATSNPSIHEMAIATSWMLHQSTPTSPSSSSPNNCYYSNYNGKDNNNNNKNTSLWKLLPALILMLVPWIPCQHTKLDIHARKAEIQSLIVEQKEFVRDLDKYTETMKELRQNMEVLTKQNELTFRETSMELLENEQYLEVEKAEETFVNRIDGLEKHIQIESQKRVKERYGSGPHRVKVTVQDNNNNGSFSHFVIELAMLMEMPHAVHHFLQMVDLKLWDGLSLVHGTSTDVIMATPLNLDSHQWAGQRFVDTNLTQMAFTEFSSTYPPPHHHKYSVAFSGRPGGPDFYISLEDDLEFHEHESTFGMVVEGRDVLDRFFLQRDHPETPNKNRAQTMTIHSITLLEDK